MSSVMPICCAPLRRHRRVRHRRRMADQRFDAAEALGQRHQPHAVEHASARARAIRARTRSAPPKPRICRFASSCCGCDRRARDSGRASPSDARPGTRPAPCALALWRSIRIGSVLVPRSTSHASIGPRIAPSAFWTKRSHSMWSSRTAIDDAADAVAVAVEELRRAVDDEVGAEVDRPLHVRAGERVVDDHGDAARVRERRRRPPGRSAAAPDWSASRGTASWSPA